GDGLIRSAQCHKKLPVPVIDNPVRWIQLDSTLEISLQAFPVPIVEANMRERPVCLSQFTVEFQRFSRSKLGLAQSVLCWGHATTCQHYIGVGDSCVRHRIIGMAGERLLKKSNTRAHALLRAPVPQIAPFQVSLVCSGGNFARVR